MVNFILKNEEVQGGPNLLWQLHPGSAPDQDATMDMYSESKTTMHLLTQPQGLRGSIEPPSLGNPTHTMIMWRPLPGTKEANVWENYITTAVGTVHDHETSW